MGRSAMKAMKAMKKTGRKKETQQGSKQRKPEKAKQKSEDTEQVAGKPHSLKRPASKLTEENLDSHQALLKAELNDAEAVENAIEKLSDKEQQMLWKKFEHNRRSTGDGEDKKYRDSTGGVGSVAKKRKLLVSWVLDKGELKENYRQAFLTLEKSTTQRQEVAFKTWKQMKNKYGQKEALSRLKAGNMKWRHSPTDGRFMEFWDVDEKVITDKRKTNTAQLHAKGKGIKAEEWMKYDSMLLDDVELEGLGQVSDKALENMEPELQQLFGKQKKGKARGSKESEKSSEEESDDDGPGSPASKKTGKGGLGSPKKKNKVDKWETMSTVSKQEGKEALQKKIVAFQAELTKDQASLTTMWLDIKKDKEAKEEAKEVKAVLEKLQTALGKLNACKKSLKKEDCKAALMLSYQCLQKAKKVKTDAKKKLKKKQGEEEEEEE
eukprot:s1056_g16.t1